MNWSIIRTLVIKDLVLFYRDKFFGLMTIFGLVLYIIFYLVMPKSIDETIEIAVHAPHFFYSILEQQQKQGIVVQKMASKEELKQAIIEKKFQFGISIPDDIQTSFFSGNKPQIYIYSSSELPEEIKEMYPAFMGEMFFGNSQGNIEIVETVLGPDMGGKQIPYRDLLLPMFVFIILVMETLGLANLITSEIESETANALLVTPMSVVEFFVSKGLTGILLAFPQAAFFMFITGTLTQHILLILFALILGTTFLTGLSFFIASVSKDMMSVVGWSVLLMIVLIIPTIGILFPVMISNWIKIIPSYFLVDILHKAVNFGIGWSGNMKNILFLLGYNIIFVSLGIMTLRRKLI